MLDLGRPIEEAESLPSVNCGGIALTEDDLNMQTSRYLEFYPEFLRRGAGGPVKRSGGSSRGPSK